MQLALKRQIQNLHLLCPLTVFNHSTVCTYKLEDLQPGHKIDGPAILFQSISTIVLEIGCTALVTADGDLDITVVRRRYENEIASIPARDIQVDPILLSIYGHRFMGIAEQMGRTLARTAISVNIKERLDFSVRLFLLTLLIECKDNSD